MFVLEYKVLLLYKNLLCILSLVLKRIKMFRLLQKRLVFYVTLLSENPIIILYSLSIEFIHDVNI